VADSASTNVALTSASTTVNFLKGAMTEVAFSPCLSSSIGSFTIGSGSITAGNFGFACIYTGNPSNGNYLQYVTPNTLAVGVYRLEYMLGSDSARAIIDCAIKINGAGSFTALRSQVDMYSASGSGGGVNMVDYFTVTTAGNTGTIRWTANGKNAASSNYYVVICSIRITLLG